MRHIPTLCLLLVCVITSPILPPQNPDLPSSLDDVEATPTVEEVVEPLGEELGAVEEPLAIKKCLPGFEDNLQDCYTDLEDVAFDLGYFGKSFDDLAGDPDNAGGNLPLKDIKDPTKPLPLAAVESAAKNPSSRLSNTPIGYLAKYGYIKGVIAATCNKQQLINKEVMLDAIATFMLVTGSDETQAGKTMMLKRCGMPDINFDDNGNLEKSSLNVIAEAIGEGKVETHRRRKRWAHHKNGRGDIGSKGRTKYTYKLHNYTLPDPKQLQYEFAKRDVRHAFALWQDAMRNSLNFTEVESDSEVPADFNLSFVPASHGDGSDLIKGEFAHAPYPLTPNHGKIHYKNTETWNYNAEDLDALNFRWITTHEIGHALGLEHTYAAEVGGVPPIMTGRYYRSTDAYRSQDVKLSDDDISAIRVLYGDISSSTNCKEGWVGFEKTCYKLEHRANPISWDQALAQCNTLDSTLVTVPNDIINSFLPKVGDGRTPFWIGRRSNLDTWTSGTPIGKYKPVGSSILKATKKKPKCMRFSASNNMAVWNNVDCGEKSGTENFVCEKEEESPTTPTPTEPTVPPAGATTQPPSDIPCQNYIRGAIRRKNYLYIFGTTLYFKYLYPRLSKPELVPGYPRRIEEAFPDIPITFTAVVNNPYNQNYVFFFDRNEVYEYKLDGKNFNLEYGKVGRKPRKIKKKFKTSNYMRGATTFDKDSIFFFAANGEIGKWTRRAKYEKIRKWDYFDTSKTKIDAVTASPYRNYLQFFSKEEYFLLRKSDGKIPQQFRRETSRDFEKLEFCDILAPLVMRGEETNEYPADIDPDTALALEDNIAY